MQAESCDAFIFRSEMKARASEGTAAQFDLCDVVIELAEVPWQGEPLVSPKADTAALRLHANQVEGKLTCAQWKQQEQNLCTGNLVDNAAASAEVTYLVEDAKAAGHCCVEKLTCAAFSNRAGLNTNQVENTIVRTHMANTQRGIWC